MEIIEKRENLELIKKVLNYYTDFVIKRKFNDIIKGIGNVEDLKNNVFDSQDEITKKRIILNFIKKKGLLITAKLMLKKRKQDNIKKMLYFIKEYIKKNYEKINEFNNTEELEYNDYMKNLNLQK